MRVRFISHWAFAWSLIGFSNALAVRILTESHSNNSYFCLRTNSTDEGHTRLTFLRNAMDGSYSLLTYTSVWSLEIRQLLECAIDNNPVVAGTYLSRCADHLESHVELSFNFSLLLNPDGPCELNPTVELNFPISHGSQHRNSVDIKSRKKRAWVFPGTLWCGRGSKASGYEQLGMFERADHCCREHDHCRNTIHAFTVNYGVFNTNFYTVSHCECDHSFRQCLVRVNDTISNMVGYSFFNILRVPCFELTQRRRCVELNWWGMCKLAKVAPYAVFKKPSPFNITQIPDQQAASHKPAVAEGAASSPNRKLLKRLKPKAPPGRCASPRGDAFLPRSKKLKKCKRSQKIPLTRSSALQKRVTQTAEPSTRTRADDNTLTARGVAPTTHTKTNMAKRARKGKKNKLPRTESKTVPSRSGQTRPQAATQTKKQAGSATLTTTLPLFKSTRQSTTTTTFTVSNPKSHKRTKGFRKRHRCGPRAPPRGDSFQPRRKACLQDKPPQLPTDRLFTYATALPFTNSRASTQIIIPSPNTTSSPPKKTSLTLPFMKSRASTQIIIPSPNTTSSPPKKTSLTLPFMKSRASTQITIPSPNTTSCPPKKTSLTLWRKKHTETVPSSKTWAKPQIQMTSFPVGFREPLQTTNLSSPREKTDLFTTEESMKPGRVRVP
ncbi:putative uncharacterized protein ENSP00000383309 [Osmerus mordax]|uniref:putative uncharacterized protein ENSP00000383309 n=1 Tax=Osmerus mordax TaxID=8014 RepID=UPI00351005E9